jgi:hypothetical protein
VGSPCNRESRRRSLHPYSADDLLKTSDRVHCRYAVNQLVEDDAIDGFAFGSVPPHTLQPVNSEFLWINLALEEIASSGQAEARPRSTACAATTAAMCGQRSGDRGSM